MTTHRRDSTPGRRLAECTTLEYILLGDLRDLLEDPPDDETCQWLLTVLDALGCRTRLAGVGMGRKTSIGEIDEFS